MNSIQILKESKPAFYNIVQVGTGATGGYVVQMVAQMMNIFKKEGVYLLADADKVEEKNLNNQHFIPKDVGLKKADVLAKRYSGHYAVNMASYSVQFIEDIESLRNLFKHSGFYSTYDNQIVHILIGCVDNNFTREIMNRFFHEMSDIVYIDAGVEGTIVPDKPFEEWTGEDKRRHEGTGRTGQVVTGVRINNETILDPVFSRFPDMAEDIDEIAPSELSCSNAIASEPQRLLTNRYAALAVCSYIDELFASGTISIHTTHLNSQRHYMRGEQLFKVVAS